MAYGGDSGNDNNGSYTLGTASGGVGSTVSYSTITQFSTNTTYYAYMTPDTDSHPHFTNDYAVACTDDAFLVAIITIDSVSGSFKNNSKQSFTTD